MKKCPKCGGEGGYYERHVMNYEQAFDWNGEAFSAEGINGYGGKIKRCLDCDKDVTKAILADEKA